MNTKSWKNIIGKTRQYSTDYEGRDDIVLWDVLDIGKDQLLKVVFLSKNSPYSQGIRLAIDAGKGTLDIDGIKSKEIHLWYQVAFKEVIVRCKAEEGLISIYNIFQKKHFPESQKYGSGMLIEKDGEKTIYRCHDVTMENVNFDKIVFSIEKIYNA